MNQQTVFQTRRLDGVRWQLCFAQAAWEMYGDPEVMRFIGGTVHADARALRERIDQSIQRYDNYPQGMGTWPVFLKSDRSLVGQAIFTPLPDTAGNLTADIEIGWHLARRQWGKGYATEFAQRLLAIGFHQLRRESIHGIVDPPNLASIKVACRLGIATRRPVHPILPGTNR